MPKIDGNEVRVGHVIEHKGRVWRVLKTEHVKPGKGGAYMQVEMRDLFDGTKTNDRLRASETIERVRLEQRAYQFLFQNGDEYTFMDQETFDQLTVSDELIGEPARFLTEGMQVEIEFYEDTPLEVRLPESVTLTVTYAEPVVKGQTASASYKSADLENGVRISVPPHIEEGQKVVVKTADGSYVEKVKE
jgi:elongation factor P